MDYMKTLATLQTMYVRNLFWLQMDDEWKTSWSDHHRGGNSIVILWI